jgi:transposase
MTKPIFKRYNQEQPMLLPPSLEELIPEGHVVRVVNKMLGEMDIEPLIRQYKGGGTSAYHPEMLVKVIVYAYTQRIYSSRQIAKALRENVNFMWLSGMNRPDHRTVNRFRGTKMKEAIGEVFYSVIKQLIEGGYIRMEDYFCDGTKIEANANRYSFVWRKSSEKHQANLQEKVHKLLEDIDELEAAEEEEYGDNDLEEVGDGKKIDAEKLREAVEKINQRLRKDPKNKELKKAKRDLEKDYIPREEKYEEQAKKFEGRNSYSKTDSDATFMRMKEDHMLNGQLKPGYNVQIGTENQFIVGYSIHQRPGDTGCLKSHLEQVKEMLGRYPKNLVADAGYGSEENYVYLQENGMTAYVKYNTFHYEQKRRVKKNQPYRAENFTYEAEDDIFVCPEGKKLVYMFSKKCRSENGFVSSRRIYECQDCQLCPVREKCTKSQNHRRLYVGMELQKLKKEAHDRLESPLGRILRSRRPVEVEAVFGRLKQDWGFRRFLLRGLDKVNLEWGILSLAHNLAKVAVI